MPVRPKDNKKFERSNYQKQIAVVERCSSCGKRKRGLNHDCKNGK